MSPIWGVHSSIALDTPLIRDVWDQSQVLRRLRGAPEQSSVQLRAVGTRWFLRGQRATVVRAEARYYGGGPSQIYIRLPDTKMCGAVLSVGLVVKER